MDLFAEVLDEELEEGEEGSRIARPRGAKVTLMDTIEPSELEKGFVRAEDKKIICEDRPERFQVILDNFSPSLKYGIISGPENPGHRS